MGFNIGVVYSSGYEQDYEKDYVLFGHPIKMRINEKIELLFNTIENFGVPYWEFYNSSNKHSDWMTEAERQQINRIVKMHFYLKSEKNKTEESPATDSTEQNINSTSSSERGSE